MATETRRKEPPTTPYDAALDLRHPYSGPDVPDMLSARQGYLRAMQDMAPFRESQKTLVERMREVVSLLQDTLGDWVGVTDTFIPENLQSISAAAKMLEDVLDQALERRGQP